MMLCLLLLVLLLLLLLLLQLLLKVMRMLLMVLVSSGNSRMPVTGTVDHRVQRGETGWRVIAANQLIVGVVR
uniref:Putative secreted protein n=1 Tax=Anopheles darlingi TaxID=43151 RepID=A0A2M4DQU8_ANODA